LLVAITLTVVVTNIMSQMYVRMSDVAVRQVGTMGAIDGAAKTVNMIVDDLKKAALVPGRSGSHDRSFKMKHGYARTLSDNVLGDNANGGVFQSTIPNGTTPGWPAVGFTQDRGDSLAVLNDIKNGSSDGYQEIFYLLAAPENSNNTNVGTVGDDLLVLYRIEDDDIHDDFDTAKTFNYSQALFDNVIYMSMIHSQTNINSGSYSHFKQIWLDTASTTSSHHFEADINIGQDPYPDAIDVILTLAPEGAYHEFSFSSDINVGTSMSDHVSQGDSGVNVLINGENKVIDKSKPFKFDRQGFFYRADNGKVFYYKSVDGGNGISQLEIFKVDASGAETSETLMEGLELVTGRSMTMRVNLK
jgi:hypothetical protein